MSTSRTIQGLRLLAAVLFLGWVVAQSPHLVHHVLEGERAHDECLLAASSDRLPGLAEDVFVLNVERSRAPHPDPQRAVSPASPALALAQARAPPPTAS